MLDRRLNILSLVVRLLWEQQFQFMSFPLVFFILWTILNGSRRYKLMSIHFTGTFRYWSVRYVDMLYCRSVSSSNKCYFVSLPLDYERFIHWPKDLPRRCFCDLFTFCLLIYCSHTILFQFDIKIVCYLSCHCLLWDYRLLLKPL